MPIKTKRKVIRLGAHSYIVSLPLGWVEYYGIKKGDKLQLIADSSLIIKAPKGRGK
jgi:phosphate uptake regulator